ncbi:MAG: hypothetical protein V1674_00445 [Candidatus Omnitrophota bacterium]
MNSKDICRRCKRIKNTDVADKLSAESVTISGIRDKQVVII